MEIKEYIKIIRRHGTLYLIVITTTVAVSFFYFTFRPVSYDTSLTLNVTRLGTQKTDQFKYDDFYRLQADEKFAETVVEWLKTPRLAADILNEAGSDTKGMSMRSLSRAIRAEKLSSQAIGVSFSAPDEKVAGMISGSIEKIISQKTEGLNGNQKEDTWFQIIPEDPIIIRNSPDALAILVVSLAIGIFLGFWVVMLRHYISS